MKRPKATLDMGTKITVREFAAALGVSRGGVQLWLRRQARKGRNYVRTERGEPALSLEGAERYLNSRGIARTPSRPRGWPTVKAVMSDASIRGGKVYQLVRQGVLRAQYHDGCLYVHPDDAAWFLKTEKETLPLPGWVPVTEVRAEVSRSQQALDSFIRRRDLPIKVFKHPKSARPSRFMRERDAEVYKVCAQESRKYTPYAYRTSTRR